MFCVPVNVKVDGAVRSGNKADVAEVPSGLLLSATTGSAESAKKVGEHSREKNQGKSSY